MSDVPVALWIVSADRDLRRRWEAAFGAAGWPSAGIDSIHGFAGAVKAGADAALVLIDADELSAEGDKGLAALKRTKVRFILFGKRDRYDDAAVIRGLDAGADDFFDKTADPLLLLAKLRAHLRRAPTPANEPPLFSPNKKLKFDAAARTVWKKAGSAWEEVRLTSRETSLLEMFLRYPGQVLERAVILERVWGEPAADVNPETVDKHVESLRKKLGTAGAGLQTVYGAGYALKE